jgi:molybdate transport system substrate-binding protein
MRTRLRITAAVAAVLLGLMMGASAAEAADITVLCSNGIKEVLVELKPVFERATGHRISVTYDSTVAILNQLKGGAKVDLVILTAEAIDDLTKQGAVTRGSRVDLAHSRIALAVRSGAPKPDISSTEALKKSLLAAKSVAITQNGVSGIHFLRVIERLGIANQVKPKIIQIETGPAGELVARGQAEIALQQFSELMPVAGIDLVGPLPGDLQRVTTFSAGLIATTRETAAANALVKFLSAESAQPVIKRKGMDPLK